MLTFALAWEERYAQSLQASSIKAGRELEGKVYIAWNPYPHKVWNQGAERDAR